MKINKFIIKCNITENKTYIKCNDILTVDVYLYEWDSLYNTTLLLYNTTSNFDNNEFWYSSTKQLNDINGFKVEIKHNNILIKEDFFNFKTIFGEKIKKQVVLVNSEVGIGDTIASTPIIKKISEIYNQKVIVLTYLPFVFINNPYVDEIIQVNEDNLNNVLNNFKTDEYNINSVFNVYGNFRSFDHKQMCAYNVGIQLKPDELDMQFYPDDYAIIENLPEKFICINPSETEPERTWGYDNWQKFINLIQEYIPVVAIGKETYLASCLTKKYSNIEIKNGLNLLDHPSQNTLSQAFHIINKSESFVTMNNGLYILALCNPECHITEISTSWNTLHYRIRKNIENYNLDYVRGECKIECISNLNVCIAYNGNTNILCSKTCHLNKDKYMCHPSPELVYESVLKKLNINQ
ncbi:hypothetical protein M0Q97_06075 [Candidatus Dojkabacteria bacterium]|jgi:hypothetical protein|nr:hypothetical protein [Candidatus Dojkabacteria bacterium]